MTLPPVFTIITTITVTTALLLLMLLVVVMVMVMLHFLISFFFAFGRTWNVSVVCVISVCICWSYIIMFNHWEQATLNCHPATPGGRGILHSPSQIYLDQQSQEQDKGILTNRVAVTSNSKTLQKQWNTQSTGNLTFSFMV